MGLYTKQQLKQIFEEVSTSADLLYQHMANVMQGYEIPQGDSDYEKRFRDVEEKWRDVLCKDAKFYDLTKVADAFLAGDDMGEHIGVYEDVRVSIIGMDLMLDEDDILEDSRKLMKDLENDSEADPDDAVYDALTTFMEPLEQDYLPVFWQLSDTVHSVHPEDLVEAE